MIPNPTDIVYVIGNGPNGLPHYRWVPRGDGNYSIALNGAAIEYVWDARFFGDMQCYRYDYFYDLKAGELRIGPRSCGDDFDYFVDMRHIAAGATCAGTCLKWLHHHIGVRSVILCGVDMFGHHADGTDSGQCGIWRQLPALQAVIDDLSSSGMTIQTISESALNVARGYHAQGLSTVTGLPSSAEES